MKTLTITTKERATIEAARRVDEMASEMRSTVTGDREHLDINQYMSEVLVEIITGLQQNKEEVSAPTEIRIGLVDGKYHVCHLSSFDIHDMYVIEGQSQLAKEMYWDRSPSFDNLQKAIEYAYSIKDEHTTIKSVGVFTNAGE